MLIDIGQNDAFCVNPRFQVQTQQFYYCVHDSKQTVHGDVTTVFTNPIFTNPTRRNVIIMYKDAWDKKSCIAKASTENASERKLKVKEQRSSEIDWIPTFVAV